jgi:deoxycytidine triphosphate deaminase
LEQGVVYTAPGVLEINTKDQLQQVGIDLRLAKASKVVGNATLSVDKNRTETPQLVDVQTTDGFYLFKAGNLYNLTFMEDVKVPANMAGIVKHRSTINRTIGTIESGWFDAGFESKDGCGAVFRPDVDVKIEVGFRCAQIVFYTATSANLYNGQYQKT